MKEEYDLQWGDPKVVRQALGETLGYNSPFVKVKLDSLTYPEHYGNSKLIEQMKDLALRQTGNRPKHLFVTCGCTGAINAALYALTTGKTDWVVTNKRRFPLYPDMVKLTDMVMIDRQKKIELIAQGVEIENFIDIMDSPSAPEGLVYPLSSTDIFDAAYSSKSYSKNGHVPAKWRIMCGSLSKTLGLPGLRLGFAATNSDEIATGLSQYINASYAGLSMVSMGIAEEILHDLDQDRFETRSARYLDDNREEAQKLLDRFGQGLVSSRGMFVILELGKIEKRALERANIKYLPGPIWGETDNWARLSLGAPRETVRNAIRSALK